MRLPFNSILYAIKDYMVIIFGLLLYALGWVGFLLPNEITTGGVTGIAALIYYGTIYRYRPLILPLTWYCCWLLSKYWD